jgi:hypothetical protein
VHRTLYGEPYHLHRTKELSMSRDTIAAGRDESEASFAAH